MNRGKQKDSSLVFVHSHRIYSFDISPSPGVPTNYVIAHIAHDVQPHLSNSIQLYRRPFRPIRSVLFTHGLRSELARGVLLVSTSSAVFKIVHPSTHFSRRSIPPYRPANKIQYTLPSKKGTGRLTMAAIEGQ